MSGMSNASARAEASHPVGVTTRALDKDMRHPRRSSSPNDRQWQKRELDRRAPFTIAGAFLLPLLGLMIWALLSAG
ncbi:MAG: hypothetical protein R3B72_06625 [Polyangiaceae bacterium]